MTKDEMYDILSTEFGETYVTGGIAVGGYNIETLEQLLYYQTGYRHFDQWLEEGYEDENQYLESEISW